VKSLKQSILAYGLLFCFGIAIIPAESFHQHDFESEVCQQSELHFADHAVDCELANFVVPAFDAPYLFQQSFSQLYFKDLLTDERNFSSSDHTLLKRGRAPPALV
tara:strand:+ start:1336 stop:1650 length:315 start_codon:yes stop_codon:yes gene_type:complete